MQADGLFWGIAAAVVIGCLGAVFAPLLRGAARAERRASYDLQVHRDQLREIDADLARGLLGEAEAAATRIEVARRLLAAAEAETAEAEATSAPRRLTRLAAPAMMAVLALGAAGLYAGLGAPGLPDQPLAPRLAREAAARAHRPGQAEAEALAARQGTVTPAPEASAEDQALVTRLQAALATRPDDLEGHRLLARSLAALGRWSDARAAEERVVEILGDRAPAKDLVDLAEIRILAAGGYVSPEAEAALSRALALDPTNPIGRYYSGLTLIQGGRPDLAYRIWSGLLQEGPPDAPWIAPVKAGLDEAARLTGLPPVTSAAPAAPGPSAADVDAAAGMPADQRQAMIESMVDQLSRRLADQGGPPADWAQLIRSLGVLGRRDQAAAILAEARSAHAGDAAGLAQIEAAARDAGVGP